jgi:hypothetical protein
MEGRLVSGFMDSLVELLKLDEKVWKKTRELLKLGERCGREEVWNCAGGFPILGPAESFGISFFVAYLFIS